MSLPITSSPSGARSQGPGEVRAQGRYLCFGRFQVDLLREELFKDGARIHVPWKVYQVLLALLERPGEIITRDELRARLWPDGTFVNYDANVNTSVNKLRLALGDSPDQPIYVETVPRQGYCFVRSVERSNELRKEADARGDSVRMGVQTETAPAATQTELQLEMLGGRLPGIFASGWAAAILLCGVLIGMGIVLFMRRPL
jgi:DNA-binding winged helix-turn-helix (wHTH) protein